MTDRTNGARPAPSGLKLPAQTNGHARPAGSGPKTPKTPQDEALAFFSQSTPDGGEPVQVWELELEDDGGPAESKSVSSDSFVPEREAVIREMLRMAL